MHPVSFAAVHPFYAQPKHRHQPAFGAADPRKQLDELCADIADGQANIRDVVATTLENAARRRDSATIRRIENTLMASVAHIELFETSVEKVEAAVAQVLHDVHEGLKQSRAYTPSTIADDAAGRPAFSDWFDSKTAEYARAYEALQPADEWARGRIQQIYR